MSFDTTFDRVIGHEGGFQCDPKDRGNWTGGEVGKGKLVGTKFGLAAMTYPTVDIKNLTVDQAKVIYKRDWWDALGMEKWGNAISFQMFDAAINHGTGRANQFLQRAARVKDDGAIGSATISAVKAMDHNDVLFRFLAERLEYFTKVKTWESYSKGWTMRVANNLRLAAEDN